MESHAHCGNRAFNFNNRIAHLHTEEDRQDIRTWASLQTKLQDTIHRSWPPLSKVYYSKVVVLAIHFENDDLGVASSEKALCQIFKNTYNVHVEKNIVLLASPLYVCDRMQAFLDKWAHEESHTIFLYSDHSQLGRNGFDLGGARDELGNIWPIQNWDICNTIIEMYPGDHLSIFSAAHDGPPTENRLLGDYYVYERREVLAASGRPYATQRHTAGPGPKFSSSSLPQPSAKRKTTSSGQHPAKEENHRLTQNADRKTRKLQRVVQGTSHS